MWVDCTGKTEALPLPEKEYEAVAISPDGRQAVIQIAEGTTTLWTLDLERGTTTPFLVSGGSSQAPVWTADGKHILYRATRNGFRNLYWKSADGTGAEAALTHKGDVVRTLQLGITGRQVGAVHRNWWAGWRHLRLASRRGSRQLGLLRRNGCFRRENPEPTASSLRDGRWIPLSIRSIRAEPKSYVRPFPGPGPRTADLHRGQPDQPRWSRDGRELYFTALDGRILAADVSIGSTFTAGVPHVVLEGPFKEQTNANTVFDVARGGRFLFVQAGQIQRAPSQIEIVLNWFTTLRSDTSAK